MSKNIETLFSTEQAQLTLNPGDINASFDDILRYHYNNNPVILRNITAVNESDESLTARAEADFLGEVDLPVQIHTHRDETDTEHLALSYQFIQGDVYKPGNWYFSRSFPNLPASMNHDSPIAFTEEGEPDIAQLYAVQQPYLDSLQCYNSHFVVTTADMIHPKFQVPLTNGLNFVTHFKPLGNLGVLEAAMDGSSELTLYGTVRPPRPTEKTMELLPQQKFWEFPDTPGIHLKAPLSLNFSWNDALTLSDVHYRIYTPIDTEWSEENPTHEPRQAYTGTLNIPSADISLNLSAEQQWGSDRTVLSAKCEGVTLGKLTQLLDLTGSDSLASYLPDTLQSAVDTLEKLELMYVQLSLTSGEAMPTLSRVELEVGFPNLEWELWEDHFTLSQLSCRIAVDNPFANPLYKQPGQVSSKPHIELALHGMVNIEGVDIEVEARMGQDWTFYAVMAQGETIPLGNLLNQYIPGVSAPADLAISQLGLVCTLGKSYHFRMMLADEPNPWEIPLGCTKLTVSDTYLAVGYNKGEGVSGSFGGAIAVGKQKLYIDYDIPGDISIKGEFQDITLLELLDSLFGKKVALPVGFDLNMGTANVIIEKSGSDYFLQLATYIEGLGYFGFEVRHRPDTGWGFAGGMAIPDVQLSAIPGLKDLASLEKVVDLKELNLFMSSYNGPMLTFPGMERFGNQALTGHDIPMPASAGGMVAGLNLYAKWQLNTEDRALKLLKSVLGLNPELDVTLQVSQNPAENSRLFFKFDTALNCGRDPFTGQLGFALQRGKPSLFMAGKYQTKIQKKPAQFDIAMSLFSSGIFLSGSMQGTLQFGNLQLSNLSMALGLNWAGIPSLGFAGQINVDSFTSSLAILLDSTNPDRSLLAGAVSDLSLADVTTTFAGGELIPDELEDILDDMEIVGTRPFMIPLDSGIVDALDDRDLAKIAECFLQHGKVPVPSSEEQTLLVCNRKGRNWSFTDMVNNMRHYQLVKGRNGVRVTQNAQLYLAPSGAQMGTVMFPQGYFLTGTLNTLGLKWTSQVDIRENKGISAESSLNKRLTVLNKKFFNLSDARGKTGPNFSLSTFSQPDHEIETRRLPHLQFSGSLTWLGMTSESYISAGKSGFTFYLTEYRKLTLPGKVFSGSFDSGWNVEGTIGSPYNLHAGASYNLDLKGKLDLDKLKLLGPVKTEFGKLKLDLAIDGNLSMGMKDKKAFIDVDGGFNLNSITHNFSESLNSTKADISQMAQVVLDALTDILKEMFDTAEEWLKALEDGLVEISDDVEQIGRVLNRAYGKTADEAAELMKDAGKTFTEIGSALSGAYGSTADEVGAIIADLGGTASDIADTLKNVYESGTAAVAAVLDGLEQGPQAITKALKSVYSQSAGEIAELLNNLGISSDEIARCLKSVYRSSAKVAAQTLDSIGDSVDDIGKALKSVYSQSSTDVTKTLKSIGADASAIGKVLKNSYRKQAKECARLLKDAGIDVVNIGKSMRSVYTQSAQATGSILKGIGKGSSDIAKAMKGAFNQSSLDMAKVLKNIGIGTDDLNKALKDIYKLNSSKAAKTLKSIGKSSEQIARSVKSVYRASSKDVAKALKYAGIGTDEIGRTLKGVYNLDSEDCAKVLKDAGMEAKEVASVLRCVYDRGAKSTGKILKKSCGWGKSSVKSALKGAGFKNKDINKAMNALKSLF